MTHPENLQKVRKIKCKVCSGEDAWDGHNGCMYYPKVYVKCPNILASMHAQQKLHDELGFQILGKTLHNTNKFVVVGPPIEYQDEKPLIISGENASEDEDWMDLFDALKLFTFFKSTSQEV